MSRKHTMRLLRWSLAGVLGGAAALLLGTLARHGHLASPLTAIATVEIVGAALLLIPRAVTTGAWLLLGTLAVAALFHFAHRQVPPAAFLVYAAGVLAVAVDAQQARKGGA